MENDVFVLSVDVVFEDATNARYFSKLPDGPRVKLLCYLDSSVNSVHYWEMDDVASNKWSNPFRITLYGRCPNAINKLDPSKLICFRIYRRFPNEWGRPCWEDSGSCNIPLCHAAKAALLPLGPGGYHYSHLRVHTLGENLSMGRIGVRLSSATMSVRGVSGGGSSGIATSELEISENSLFIRNPWKGRSLSSIVSGQHVANF